MTLDAAVRGLGVALESTFIAEPHLRLKRLRRVFKSRTWFVPVQAHFLVYPARRSQRSEVVNFVSWLRARARGPKGKQRADWREKFPSPPRRGRAVFA
jgi:DNA-binding transcriptional LysR family regulator